MTKDQMSRMFAQSDKRIAAALEVLNDHHRGQSALRQMKTFLSGDVAGLDMIGQDAVIILMQEFCKGGRRDFISKIK